MSNVEETVENVGYGLSSWDKEPNVPKRQQREDLPQLPFLRLKEGNNIIRIVTAPYVYNMIRFKGPGDKRPYGTRVNSAYPKYDSVKHPGTEDCPTKPFWTYNREAGEPRPKERFLCGVIDRNQKDKDGNPAPDVKIYDLSQLVFEQLHNFKDDPEYGPATTYDINIRFNPKATSPQGFYTVIPRPKAELSEADLNLIEEVGEDLHKVLLRHATPPPPEVVRKRMMDLGWDGKPPVKEEKEDKSNGSSEEPLATAQDDDYDFPHPAADAN